MPCLDMQNGRVVKGVHFVDIANAGDPVECARAYCAAGADELAMLDITATVENRPTLAKVVREVAAVCTVPFTVGGGINDVKAAANVLEAGANKVSVSSAAFRKPELIGEIIREFGREALTVAIDVDVNPALPSGYEVYIDGGRTATGADALEWAKRVDGYGVPVILPTSKAGDGAKTGYDLPVITIIFNNQVLGMVRQWQTAFYGKRYSSTDPHRKTDYVKLAEGFGLKGYHCETVEEFRAAFAEALASKKPAWIECRIDKDEKVLPMIPAAGNVDDIMMS